MSYAYLEDNLIEQTAIDILQRGLWRWNHFGQTEYKKVQSDLAYNEAYEILMEENITKSLAG